MKKSLFLLPLALFAISASATQPIRPCGDGGPCPPLPPIQTTEKLDTLGVEFLQLLNARDQQADLIADKMKLLFEAGNTIREATVTHHPRQVGGIYRKF